MAKYNDGINGEFSGKVGPVVGAKWNGISVMRSRPAKTTKPPSEAQVIQRAKLAMAGKLMSTFKKVIAFGFNITVSGKTNYDKAVSYLMDNAIDTGTQPFSIRYNKLLLTNGQYPGADDCVAAAGEAGQIVFSWKDNTGLGSAKAGDKVLLIGYSPIKNVVHFSFGDATRSEETAILNINLFIGDSIETYISFLKANESVVSPSIYTGQVLVGG